MVCDFFKNTMNQFNSVTERERDDYRWAEVTFSLFEAHVGRLLEFKEAHAIIY